MMQGMKGLGMVLAGWVSVGAALAGDFEKDIAPLLERNCVECHRAGNAEGGLRLDDLAEFEKGGDSGPALVRGKPEESELFLRVDLPADDIDIMPPEGDPLSGEEVALLRGWIESGATWPAGRKLVARDPADDAAPVPLPDRGKALVGISVFPAAIQLDHGTDRQSVVAVGRYEDDTTYDVTANVAFELKDGTLAERRGRWFHPVKDGQTTLEVSLAGQRAEIPVEVRAAAEHPPVTFRNDVIPVFMREGCNTGACHGSARGQDGFMLSLFGYDPAGDYHRITREWSGRRINLALPEESLLVAKSIEAVPHTGGKLFESGSESWATLVSWIEAGVPDDPKDLPEVTAVEILPRKLLLEGEGTTQQLTVRATYSDGSDRDVTPLAVFLSNNDPTAAVDEDGLITAGKRGEAFVMARFDTFTVGSQVIVIPDGLKYERPPQPSESYIDELVGEKLHLLRMEPSELCSDEDFLRRVHLDITGLLPQPEDHERFLADDRPDKRERLVDELIGRKEFTEMWVMKWAELLQIRSFNNANQGMSYKAALLYFNWLQERIANNMPMDDVVRDLLSASGGTFSNPPTNYYNVEQDVLKVSENVAQVFMGFRLQCAQCHNHPFDRWTMDDYYGWSAFFTQIGRKRTDEDPRQQIVFNKGSGEAKNPVDNQVRKPRFLGGDQPELQGRDRRAVMAEWLTSPDNPYFAKNLANIIWAHFFGAGIIDPVDDVRVSNPASNPELLEALGARLIEYDYDFRRLVRDICNSHAYQRSTRANESNRDDLSNFAKARVRRLRAEVMLDAITQVTETKNKFRGLPLGARAVQIADGNTNTYFLRTFGRASRETVCSCEVSMDPSLSQALHLINGDTVTQRIGQGGVIRTALEVGQTPEAIVEGLYVRCYSRLPSKAEMEELRGLIDEAKDRNEQQAVLEDLFWALLNSKEFMFNH